MESRLLEQKNGVSFLECLEQCLQSELLEQWERLAGKKLLATNTLDRMIDKASGYDLALMKEFADFVYNHVWINF